MSNARAALHSARSLVLAAALLLIGGGTVSAQQAVTVTDVTGRTVTIPSGPRRLLIDDGRYLIALSFLHPNPVSLLAGWPHDINRIGEEVHAQYLDKFPALARVPRVSSSAGAFSLELALAAEPTVAIFTEGLGPDAAGLRRLNNAGIPVVFVDFVSNPLENLDRSLEILGAIVGRSAQARELIEFRRSRRDEIVRRLASARPTAPRVFMEAHAGRSNECCNSPGRGNVGEYISLVRGQNIGAGVLPGAFGQLSLEYVLDQEPEVYILTGGPHLEGTGGFVIGPEYTEARARQSLERVVNRTGIRLLGAVRTGRVHGLSHQLLNSPLDVVVLELLAKWIHPNLFSDLQPSATLAEINRRFLAVPVEGAHWVDLR